MRITQHMNTNAFIHVKLLQNEGLLETWPPKWSILCYKIKLHPFGSEKNAYCPHLKCGDNYMPHYSSCVISGHIQHLAQRQFRVCSKQRQSRKRHGGHILGSQGNWYSAWNLMACFLLGWRNSNFECSLCRRTNIDMLFRERGREKNGKRKPSQIYKDIRGGGGVCMCMSVCVPACIRPTKSGSHALAWEDLGVREY